MRQDLFFARPHVSVNSRVDLLALLSWQFPFALAWCPSRVLQVAPYSVIEVRAFLQPIRFRRERSKMIVVEIGWCTGMMTVLLIGVFCNSYPS